jgi:hypothetical protein
MCVSIYIYPQCIVNSPSQQWFLQHLMSWHAQTVAHWFTVSKFAAQLLRHQPGFAPCLIVKWCHPKKRMSFHHPQLFVSPSFRICKFRQILTIINCNFRGMFPTSNSRRVQVDCILVANLQACACHHVNLPYKWEDWNSGFQLLYNFPDQKHMLA